MSTLSDTRLDASLRVATYGYFVLIASPAHMGNVLNQKDAIKLLEKHGWERTIGGKHNVKMVKNGASRPITLPMHKRRDYPKGLASAILKQAGLDWSDV